MLKLNIFTEFSMHKLLFWANGIWNMQAIIKILWSFDLQVNIYNRNESRLQIRKQSHK